MNNITLICTRHRENGACNSLALVNIIESIKPEIIFEELSVETFNQFYEGNRPGNVETNAIKIYLLKELIKHLPVDTFHGTNAHEDAVVYLYKRMIGNRIFVETRDFCSLLDKQSQLENQYGFDLLNSTQNDEIFEELKILEEKILSRIDDEHLFRKSLLNREIIEKREDEIIQNIVNYSRDNKYHQAILFIGSGHRKSMMKKLEVNKLQGDIKLNWTVYKSTQTPVQ